jgi:hypothetical protein
VKVKSPLRRETISEAESMKLLGGDSTHAGDVATEEAYPPGASSSEACGGFGVGQWGSHRRLTGNSSSAANQDACSRFWRW